jgi:hypothetical protein
MPWFVPTHGDHMFLGVEAQSRQELRTSEQKLSALTGRLYPLANWQARAIGQDLMENGALSEAPSSREGLTTAVLEDPAFAEFAMAMGLESEYRPARPEEAEDLQAFDLAFWPLRLHHSGLE